MKGLRDLEIFIVQLREQRIGRFDRAPTARQRRDRGAGGFRDAIQSVGIRM